MKEIAKDLTAWLFLLLAAALLAGCAGLNVSGAATITYNTPAVTVVTMTPGAIDEAPAKP